MCEARVPTYCTRREQETNDDEMRQVPKALLPAVPYGEQKTRRAEVAVRRS